MIRAFCTLIYVRRFTLILFFYGMQIAEAVLPAFNLNDNGTMTM